MKVRKVTWMKSFIKPLIENRRSIIIFLITCIFQYSNDDDKKDLFLKCVLMF
jgi:hypothetical protein